MENMPALIIFLFCVSILCFTSVNSLAQDTLTSGSNLTSDGDTLISEGEIFELGFFSPNESLDMRNYVGIWYHKFTPKTVVWVANRDEPLPETVGYFAMDNGNLKVLDESGKDYWSTGLDYDPRSQYEAKLMDSGNLVLRNKNGIVWQSFQNPTDTFLPYMSMAHNNLTLTSWKNQLDPALGEFTFKQDEGEDNQFVVNKNGYIPRWRSGESGEFSESDKIPPEIVKFLFNTSWKPSSSRNNSTMVLNNNTRMVMNISGVIQYWMLDTHNNEMSLIWSKPSDNCSVDEACGSFGSCNTQNEWACKCLPGFRPANPERWRNRVFSDGCIRNSNALCSENDIFLNLSKMRVGNTEKKPPVNNETDCKIKCLSDCRCLAYSYTERENSIRRGAAPTKPTCWIWTDPLKNLQEDFTVGGHKIHVRLAISDLESTARNCEACGTYAIPYPLSTASSCGDPMYFSFYCNNSMGELRFKVPTGDTYNVRGVDTARRTFIIQGKVDNCSFRTDTIQLKKLLSNFPYKVINETHWCNTGADSMSDSSLEGVEEIEISWNPPLEPICNSLTDCKDWPDSSCNVKRDGKRRCLCNANFKWDGLALNCTRIEEDRNDRNKDASSSRFLIIGVTVASFLVLSCALASICTYIYRRNMVKIRERRDNTERNRTLLYGTEKRVKDLIDSGDFKEEDKKGIDVPYFELDSILAATDNFSDENKLGRGGFGPVYKGTFQGGQAIAVKRLLSVSGQGLEEFKNEVVLIARLQHRNLVKLLGYCIKGSEKILLYEYMPNKSLDYFIFDEKLGLLLNWELRFNIILGVARGLLYLHQDSRLRIIHRDLKTSNILLDTEMNPKISDFGLARIFEGKQTEGMTNRVVGTYGYMPPEYALDGLFSVKSDAFSYGVVVLEILSGRRNTRVVNPEEDMNLLVYAWRLWREYKAEELMDMTIRESCKMNEFLKCLHIALLCVQHDPNDRPTMSTVLVLLSSEALSLPIPKQPAFVERKPLSDTASSSSKPEISTQWSTTLGGR